MMQPEKLFAQTRNEAGLSQNRLASLAGYDHSYVSRIESGTRTPSRDALAEFVEAMEGRNYYALMDSFGYVTNRHVLVPLDVSVEDVEDFIEAGGY